MAKAKKKAQSPKPRADKYDEKLAIKGTFAQVFFNFGNELLIKI